MPPKLSMVEGEGRVFLEVERFDRVGPRGRRGLVSLLSLDAEFVGSMRSWTESTAALEHLGKLPRGTLARVRWLDLFGAMIGNTGRHAANLSFRFDRGVLGGPAPAYDMLPMHFHPIGGVVVERPMPLPTPPPSPDPIWASALAAAIAFWEDIIAFPTMSPELVRIAEECRARVLALPMYTKCV